MAAEAHDIFEERPETRGRCPGEVVGGMVCGAGAEPKIRVEEGCRGPWNWGSGPSMICSFSIYPIHLTSSTENGGHSGILRELEYWPSSTTGGDRRFA